MVNGMNFLFHADSPLFGDYSEIIPRRNTGDKAIFFFSRPTAIPTKGTVPFVFRNKRNRPLRCLLASYSLFPASVYSVVDIVSLPTGTEMELF